MKSRTGRSENERREVTIIYERGTAVYRIVGFTEVNESCVKAFSFSLYYLINKAIDNKNVICSPVLEVLTKETQIC